MELIGILKGIELFRGLNDAQLRQIASISQKEVFDEDEVIVSIDSPGDQMYVIAEGQVEILTSAEKQTQRAAVYLGEGQVFGEVALLDRGNRSATVLSAQDGTTVYAIPRDQFLAICQQDTALGFVMMRNLALDLSFKLRHYNLNNP